MTARRKLPRDFSQRALEVVRIATGQAADPDEGKDPAAIARGRLGGIKGGKARAEKLSAAQRKAIAKKAAATRWKKD